MTGVQYKPWNAFQQFSLGNGLTENWTYNNSRMQPLSVTAMKGSNTLLTLNTWYCTGASPAQDCTTNNGNVMQAWAGPSATPAYKQTFAYDSLNRLTAAAEGSAWIQSYDGVNRLQASSDSGGWSEQFGYDRYGNVYLSATPSGLPIQTQMPTTVNAYDAATNHLQAGAHDAAGNQTIYGGWQMTYDAENRQIGAYNSTTSTTVSYTYDGAGQRVSKTIAGGATTAYVHDVFGRLAAEYTSAPAPAAPCSTCYLSWDQLGSTRMVTDASGNIVARHDCLPFGVEIPSGSAGRTSTWGTSDSLSKKFTAQEHDYSDTGLDFFQARYHASGQGRFLSPDPAGTAVANPADPQTWNMFAYVRNNPLSFIDPSGSCYQDSAGNYWDEDGAPCSVSTGGAINYGQTTTVTVNGDTGDVSTATVMWDFGDGGAGQTSVVFYAQGTARNQAVVSSAPSNFVRMPLPPNAQSCSTNTGANFNAPPGFSVSNIAANGQTNGLSGAGAAVGQGGYYDFQRSQVGSTTQFFPGYTPVANIAVGAYLQGAGVPQWMGSLISNTYAFFNSSNGATAQQAQFRNLGFSLASGKAAYSCQAHP